MKLKVFGKIDMLLVSSKNITLLGNDQLLLRIAICSTSQKHFGSGTFIICYVTKYQKTAKS